MVNTASSRQIHLKNIVPPTFVIVKIGFQEQNRTGCAVFDSQLYKLTPVLDKPARLTNKETVALATLGRLSYRDQIKYHTDQQAFRSKILKCEIQLTNWGNTLLFGISNVLL